MASEFLILVFRKLKIEKGGGGERTHAVNPPVIHKQVLQMKFKFIALSHRMNSKPCKAPVDLNKIILLFLDEIQVTLGCCGSAGAGDWLKYGAQNPPDSCCSQGHNCWTHSKLQHLRVQDGCVDKCKLTGFRVPHCEIIQYLELETKMSRTVLLALLTTTSTT